MPREKELLVGLLDYIQEQAKIVKPDGFRLSLQTGLIYFPKELASLPGITFNVEAQGDHVWLRVERLTSQAAPTIPDTLTTCVAVTADPYGRPPVLNAAAVDEQIARGKTNTDLTALRADIVSSFDAYCVLWAHWAEREKPRRQSIEIYGSFFALKHQIEAEETARPQELVWGIGVASWQIPNGGSTSAFEYPLLTQAVEISIDDQFMAIELRPRETEPRLEVDAFVGAQIPGTAEAELAAKAQLTRLGAGGLSPFDASSYGPVMKLIAGSLDSTGSYRQILAEGESCPPAGTHLLVTDSWVIFARPRQNNFLLEDLKRLKEKVESTEIIPPGPLALVTPPSDDVIEHISGGFRGLSSGGRIDSAADVQELYFPLPYNDEQVTIIERLERAPGVTVQGPPGTGKTHTIANVICHYLATGRRVLVTSRGEPALEVLQAMLPAEVRPLTVALLATDREGVRQFQASIQAIQHEVSQLNVQATQYAIATLHTAIERVHHELAEIDRRIDDIAMAQLGEIIVDGESMRAQKAAEFLINGESEHGWFDDELTIAEQHRPPLTEDDAASLRQSRRQVGSDLPYLTAKVPKAEQLPTAQQIAELHQTITSLKRLDDELATTPNLAFRNNSGEAHEAAIALLQTVRLARSEVAALENEAPKWGALARERFRLLSYAPERGAFEAMFGDIDALVIARADFLKRPVVLPPAAVITSKTLAAIDRAATSGKAFPTISIGNNEAKQQIATVRVSGLPPRDVEDWVHVQRYANTRTQLLSFVARWNTFAEALSLPVMADRESDLRRIEKQAVGGRRAYRIATFIDKQLVTQSASVFNTAPIELLLGNAEATASVEHVLQKLLARSSMAHAAEARIAFLAQLASTSGAISQRLSDFANQMLGNATFSADQVSAEYVQLMAELRRIAALQSHLHVIRDSSQRLRDSGAVRWADRIVSIPAKNSGDDEVVPARWRKSWTWARIRGHLEAIEGREELRSLVERRADLETGLRRLYRELVGKSAWLSAKHNATPRILSALTGYATAIRRIGQGTGPNATRYRRDARDAMIDAAGAVPCWIMSHARVSESMPAEIGAFDLVIVDEASQSDLWALPAILRGKKILVVGDDKQVSPDGGFISAQLITALRARFLGQQPFGAAMTPGSSLYDLAARVFAGHQVMLREHFRCVAPIIAYSNHAFYNDAIQPLRIPLASERLDPPLVDVYVPSGMRDKKDQNHNEALAIADEIQSIFDNPAMAGRTLGVVSLLGLEQARHIDEVVRSRCSASELMLRKFEAGDARTFQGSERDIMFLSLVADRESHHALSGARFEQRFNVAASRARDRMYLVRSVELSDLSAVDLRKTLLEHFDKPTLTGQTANEDLVALCESGFEREVFLKLVDKGYHVIPQVKVGAYRIDMVVEGRDDRRLAIELDGDAFHGPDRWAQDMNRQRILERAGWSFWRCFASTWSLHTVEAFDELLLKLGSMQIEPIGALAQIPILVERRVWEPPTKSDEGDDVSAAIEAAVSTASSP